MISWNWPLDFPENCPPPQASPANGIFYRIVKTDSPELRDFVSVYHENPKRAESAIKSGNRTKCETMGLSVYADKNDAIDCAQRYRKLGNMIAHLELVPTSGKTAPTYGGWPSHTTWWKAEGHDPVSLVQFVQDVDAP